MDEVFQVKSKINEVSLSIKELTSNILKCNDESLADSYNDELEDLYYRKFRLEKDLENAYIRKTRRDIELKKMELRFR